MLLSAHNLSLSKYQAYLSGVFDLLQNILIIALVVLALLTAITIIIKIIRLIRHLREPFLFLEITPPVNAKVPNVTTSQLFNLLFALMEQRSWVERMSLRNSPVSFEIVSNRNDGIKYLIRSPKSRAVNIEKLIRSYLPGSKIKKATDYIHQMRKPQVMEMHQTKHFSLPLADHSDLKNHDPLNYLTGSLNRLDENEYIAIQMVLKPLGHSDSYLLKREAARIRKVLHRNNSIDWSQNSAIQRFANLFVRVIEIITRAVMLPFFFAAEFITGSMPEFASFAESRKTTAQDEEHSGLAKQKLSEPLFAAAIRIMIDSNNMPQHEKSLKSSFSSFRHSTGQNLRANGKLFSRLLLPYRKWKFDHRLEGGLVLSTSEAGSLYHFPYTEEAYSEDLSKIKSRELPAPLSFKKDKTGFDIVIGANKYNGSEILLGLTLDQRRKHTYVIGKTGTGKTTLLMNAICQDMQNGKGLAVLDPHGDMFRELLGMVPKERIDDVIVFDPSDRSFPIGLNILRPGIKFSDKEDEEEWITSSVLAIFAKMTAKEYWGPRMEHILRNTTLTALQTENPSLYTLQRLLTDKSFQKKTAATLTDPVLKQFWNKEFALLGKMQLSSAVAPLTQRLGSFMTSKMSRHILLQEKSTISISEIMDEGKILLVNLSKGDIGEDHSFFFGAILTSFIWMAAYQRTKIPESKRRDFFLYVDEFQNFATPRFSEITSEGRKFRVSLTASHQNIAQVEDQSILKIVAGNANNLICLKASPDEEKFILPFMEPEVAKGDIVNLAPYHFYMKANNHQSENAFSGETIPPGISPSDEIKEAVITSSRSRYATPRAEVEQFLDDLLTSKPAKSRKPADKGFNPNIRERKSI